MSDFKKDIDNIVHVFRKAIHVRHSSFNRKQYYKNLQ